MLAPLLPPEMILCVLNHVDATYGPVIESVCRDWHCLWDARHHFVDDDLLLRWASAGHKRLLEWAFGSGWIRRGHAIVTLAVENGHLDIVEWCLERGLRADFRTQAAAARRGDLALLKRLNPFDCPWDDCVYVAAAKGGYLDLLKSMIRPNVRWPSASVCMAAAKKGHRHILEWVISHGRSLRRPGWHLWDARTCSSAAEGGHLDLLQWLRANDCPWDYDMINSAALHGHVDAVKWALASGSCWSARTCTEAAHSGNLELLEWLLKNGCPYHAASMSDAAAEKGHLAMLKWLQAEGYPQRGTVIAIGAVDGGHAAVLDWLEASGHGVKSDWITNEDGTDDDPFISSAASKGRVGVLAWLHDRGYAHKWIQNAVPTMAYRGQIGALAWARSRGYSWDARACAEAATSGRLGTLRWLRRQECPWDADTCREAAKYGHLCVLQWALEHGCPWDAASCLEAVDGMFATKRRARVQTWLKNHLDRSRQQQQG
jgi:hypothetical protein